jgi:hypothetical protein
MTPQLPKQFFPQTVLGRRDDKISAKDRNKLKAA